MARGKETELSNHFRKTLEKLGHYAYKIPDDTSSRFKIARPFDMVASIDGRACAIEFKWRKTPESINQNSLSPNQRAALEKFEASGGLALVGLFVKVGRGDLRLLIWRYSDFKERGRVLAREQVKEPYIAYYGRENVFDASQTAKRLLDLENGF
jgi:hypothetical protein